MDRHFVARIELGVESVVLPRSLSAWLAFALRERKRRSALPLPSAPLGASLMTEKANAERKHEEKNRPEGRPLQFGDCLGEDFCVLVYVGGGGVRTHEGHVVEWGQEDAAV